MKKIILWVLLVLMVSLSAVPAFAVSSAEQIRSDAIVTARGECQITTTVNIRLEENIGELTFPLPSNAKNITMNGVTARAKLQGGVKVVDITSITGGHAGDFTVTFQFSLADVVAGEKDKVFVTVPLLSGFTYPVENMEFTVTFPGTVSARPGFSSGYFQDSIEGSLDFVVQGNVVSGIMTQPLKDRETLSMTLEVPENMFPNSVIRTLDNSLGLLLMILCFVLALVYYLLTMRPNFSFPHRQPNAPAGITAGELGAYLHGGGTDLTALVLSWAQMGYLMLQLDDTGRVLLHRRMDMGSERSSFENRAFHSLFGRRNVVDGSGYHYALLAQKLRKKAPGAAFAFRKTSGNPAIFRFLCALAGFFGGVAMACAIVEGALWRIFLSMIFGTLCGGGSLLILSASQKSPLRSPADLVLALFGSIAVLLCGIIAGQFPLALLLIGAATLSGLLCAIGGRRTELGRQAFAEIWGLRRYLMRGDRTQIQRAVHSNPDYFYELAPYALALGADKALAKKCGNAKLPECPWLTAGMTGQLTAAEFADLLRHAVDALNRRAQLLPLEKLLGK